MFKRMSQMVVVGAIVASVISPVSAQGGGGSRGSASYSGGSAGGPGMSGSAVNIGTPSYSAPSPTIPEVTIPSGGNGGANVPSGGSGQRPSGGSGQRPSGGNGGANIPSGGERPTFDFSTTERPAFGEGLPTFGGGGSFDPTQLQSLLTERGTENISLEGLFGGEDAPWAAMGGFGAMALGANSDLSQESLNMTLDELMKGVDSGLEGRSSDDTTWTAPSAYDGEMSGIIEAQENAQAAAQQAGDNAQDAITQATEQAQASYDQFWTDYYAAVDYTAQAYYDTVTATADYLLQSYYTAVSYTVEVVDYYLAYYEQYAVYCYYYPWDCYSYAYDVATGTYYYVGDTSDQPVGTVTVGDITVTVDPITATQPVPSAEAYEAIVLFANDQLAAVVEPQYAGDATTSVQEVLALMPDEFEALMAEALDMSCADYYALMTGGVGAVLVGDCSTGTAQNLDWALTSAAVGAYGLRASAAVPTTEGEALNLITTVYPKLEGLAFATVTDVNGYAYLGMTAGTGYDAVTGAPVSVPKIVFAGVTDVGGVPYVYSVVFVGKTYVEAVTALLPQS